MCNPCQTVVPLIIGDTSRFLRCPYWLEQIRMIALFDSEDRVKAGVMQGFNVWRIGTEPIFGDDTLQMRVILASLRDEAFGGMALTIVFLSTILFDNGSGHQGNHFTPVRMHEGGAQHLMRIGDRPVTVMLFETRRTMNLCGGKIPSAIEGEQITAFEKHHLFKRFAALKAPKDGLERWPK